MESTSHLPSSGRKHHCPSTSDPHQVPGSRSQQPPAASGAGGGGFVGAATSPSAASSSDDYLSSIEDRLATLGHSVSEDVIPGIEREMNKVRPRGDGLGMRPGGWAGLGWAGLVLGPARPCS